MRFKPKLKTKFKFIPCESIIEVSPAKTENRLNGKQCSISDFHGTMNNKNDICL